MGGICLSSGSVPDAIAKGDFAHWTQSSAHVIPGAQAACLTLGLAPFVPEPHIWEKLKMLAAGSLVKPIDMFDLALHAAPFVLLGLKLIWGRSA